VSSIPQQEPPLPQEVPRERKCYTCYWPLERFPLPDALLPDFPCADWDRDEEPDVPRLLLPWDER
jgi:hypothetical protein